MIDPKDIQNFAKSFVDSLPPAFGELNQEIKSNLQTLLIASLTKLNLVTREEFDAQAKVLAKTRIKVDALEKAVRDLEAKS